MAWDSLKCDNLFRLTGIVPPYYISEYLFKKHGISVPKARTKAIDYIVIAGALVPETTVNGDTAKEYVRNANTNGLIPHYYAGSRSTWQVLDLNDCWQMSNGMVNENSICIAPIICSGLGGGDMYTFVALHDLARIISYLLKKYNLTEKNIKVTKECSPFIRQYWKELITEVRQYLKKL